MQPTDATWNVIIPIKRLDVAKSRLILGAAGQRRRLALAFAQDVMLVVVRVSSVRNLIVVTADDEVAEVAAAAGAHVVSEGKLENQRDPDTADGDAAGEYAASGFSALRARALNVAIRLGGAYATKLNPANRIAVLAADLPTLRVAELEAGLRGAADHPRAFTSDAAGLGTNLLTAAVGTHLNPMFGANSAMRHRESGAVDLSAHSGLGLRLDVDTAVQLNDAILRGVGPLTALAT